MLFWFPGYSALTVLTGQVVGRMVGNGMLFASIDNICIDNVSIMKMGSVCESFELVPGGKRKNNKITEPFLSFEQQALEIATYQDL